MNPIFIKSLYIYLIVIILYLALGKLSLILSINDYNYIRLQYD